jgi:superfamily II DNA helicase RecQ
MEIKNIVKKHLLEALVEGGEKPENYMFFGNIQQMARQCELLMKEDHDRIDSILKEHDWAQDHIAEAKSLLDQVFDFLMNETTRSEESLNETEEEIDESKNCPTDPAKWAASKAAAKAKFDVYPSAYANGWAAKNYKAKGGRWKKCKK